MTENIDIVKVKSLVQTERLINEEIMYSLKRVSEEIQQTIDVVDTYKRKVETLCPPVVNGEPWYKFSFGKASVTEVNKVMESFSEFVQETFKLVATSQNFQNENDMNICRLIGLLAIAEGNSYEKLNDIASEIKDLSTEDEESTKQLKELEKSFLQSLDDSALDNSKKEEQMARLIDYVTLFAESKTKKIRSISLTLSDVKEKLDKYSNIQDSWIEEANSIIASWQTEISNSLDETCKQLEATIIDLSSKKNSQLDESFEKLRNELVAKMKEQDEKLSQEMERQNARINESLTIIDDKITNYQTLIDDQNRAISNQNDYINNLHEKQKKEIDEKMADQDKKLSQEIDHQNTNISDFQTAIENKLAECKTTIEKQADTISSQNDSINKLNETVASLKSKAYLALGIGTISFVSIIGTMLFLLIR